ncbi:G-type lectin S-receptor-like serine/threonine-protein kinase At4g27290 [Durio zibethinus]|uniref:Receptor-like serine/threonine-protein kinase n=1 Tax=Durio zibethinus TaxID=66656 RepID=A0A6P5ZNK0_DURZI|nr:G-type lectin S-receptor-like serine/threonine-protein kinase At4g27290 [Durio zibethinus]
MEDNNWQLFNVNRQLKSSLTSLFFYLLTFLSIMKLLFAADTIAAEQSISDGQTLVSSSQSFELGFFSPGNSKKRFLGIWYKNLSGAVVWVANRNSPIADAGGVLTLNSDGNLILFDGTNSTVWSSNISRKAEGPVAQLLDSGNLVVKDNKTMQPVEVYLWQSFDYLSDTLLPGMKLGKNLKTGSEWLLTSWKSADDPSPGNFTCRLSIQGLPSIVAYLGSAKMFRSGPWDGFNFGGTPVSPTLVQYLVHNEDEIYYSYEPFNNPIITRLTMDQSGTLLRVIWNERSSKWDTVFLATPDKCDLYGQCSANGICNINKTPICECLKGFRPESEGMDSNNRNWSKKCVKESSSDCQNREGFLKLVGVKLPDFIEFKLNESMNLMECEMDCLKNCSCSAYASTKLDEQDKGCLMWYGDLIDMKNPSGQTMGHDIYVRVPSSELGSAHASNEKKQVKIIIVVSIISGMLVLSLVSCFILRKKWKRGKHKCLTLLILFFDFLFNFRLEFCTLIYMMKQPCCCNCMLSVIPGKLMLAALFCYIMKKIWKRGQESCKDNVEVPLFDLASIVAATNSFSQENLIGIGGFGPVYKGILPTGKEIAVKRLSKNSGQGAEEFRNEVVLIAKLQHRNLVGLCGSCIQGEERLLVYEYMPNKSLDYFIFDHDRRVLLAWQKRFDIIMQIVRGLLYLHQDSKLQIIHRDLKAMNPKISDFGLARTFEGDDKVSETKRVVGTFGYMSPEYAVNGKFSAKSDVFSFGVLLLEIISGQKISSFCHPDHHHSLLGHAWLLWNEGRAMELVDACLEDSIVESQVLRCIQVGLLCVQNLPKDRPTMSSVNFMLANEVACLPYPKEPGFFTDRSCKANTDTRKEELHTVNVVTITMLGGR